MIAAYEELNPDALALLGFSDPTRACRLLQDMAGHNVPDSVFDAVLPSLTAAMAECADPDRAAANLARWADAVGSRLAAYRFLAANPLAARILVTVLAASQFFADLLVSNPENLEALTNPALRSRPRDTAAFLQDMERRVTIAKTPNARRDALRRVKGPEILRIGVRDLLGDAPVPVIVREISDFADACVQMALTICREEHGGPSPAFAVIAMGKLGGQELNYSSDIDLIYVHGDDEDAGTCIKLGEAVRDTLAKAATAGYVFRVDLRLRPEGRFGPISRSLSSCRAYYESWAEPWERQALIKARFVAGDGDVGAKFIAMTQEFVYQHRIEESVVQSIRHNKRRLEQKIAGADEAEINVKEGVGGIRDVEFLIQLMQLLAGGAHPSVRTGSTLVALDSLAAIGLLTEEERDVLRESYLFLRTVEHRLQLLDDRAVRCLPRGQRALNALGRTLAYLDGAAFEKAYRAHTHRVHALFTRLFYQESGEEVGETTSIGEWVLAPDDTRAQEALRAALAGQGFRDADAALQLLRRAVAGSEYGGISPEARESFARLAGPLIAAAAATDAPDAALNGIDSLALAAPSRAALYRTLEETPGLLPRLCLLAADAPALWQTLLVHLEFFDLLADEEIMAEPLASSPTPAATSAVLAARSLRQRLHTGARDVWGLSDTEATLSAVSHAAERALADGIALARRETGWDGRFAVIGMGKLGGGELGYGSDLDVLYVADPTELAYATRLAERLQTILSRDLAQHGFRYEVDARLRPDGRKGTLVLDVATYGRYYAASAATWERQALLRARPVAGDDALGRDFSLLVEQFVFGRGLAKAETDEIRALKRRIETERLKNPHDLKLAHGGMADIEWTTQLFQLRFGHAQKRLRKPGTLHALRALRDEARMTQADWETLSDTYVRLSQLRNRLFLRSGVSIDAPPTLPEDLSAVMAEARAVCRRLFYGEA